MRLVYVVNNFSFFVSHRLELALAAKRSGFEVTVVGPMGPDRVTIESSGIETKTITFTRRGWNPFVEFLSLWQLFFTLKKLEPTVVHAVALKAVVYTALLSPFLRTEKVIGSIAGLGSVFVSEKLWALLLRTLAKIVLSWSLRSKRTFLIFQNEDDRENFVANKLISRDRCLLILGSGVDLQKYKSINQSGSQSENVKIVFPGRILRDKGIQELIQATRILKKENSLKFEVQLAGSVDLGNPSGVAETEILGWEKEGLVKWLGYQSDMAKIFRDADIVCLPSYREGLSLALIEASASGRAIITTDVPGCRDVVDCGATGLTVPVRNYEELAAGLKRLILSPVLRLQLGAKARSRAEKYYGKEKIIEQTLDVYGLDRSFLKKIV